MPTPTADDADLRQLAEVHAAFARLKQEVGRVIVGQHDVVEQVLVAILSGGHCLLVGVPGLAKTLLVKSIAESLGLSFSRIQFTPDLMPADITGTEVIQEDRSTGARELRFLPGPIFAQVVLADEINRTPPKTQAALLEAMQERQVTVGGARQPLPRPFFVLATQNPIEQEGTYPLPEAQRDRFLFEVRVRYPSEEEELQIVRQTTLASGAGLSPILSAEQMLAHQEFVRRIPAPEHVLRYATLLARSTRPDDSGAPEFVRQYVTWGAGPRASQSLVLAALARAGLHGRPCATLDDLRAVAAPVFRHRLVLNFSAEADNIGPDDLVRRLLECIPREAGA
ncbi:MAG: MoxR family ATPase [Planctomyces sp.]|nr:MoxR family ATPase [Planctomyces sp.]